MANTYLTRTVSSGADITKCTFSFWLKRSKLDGDQRIFSNQNTTAKQLYIRFDNNNQFTCTCSSPSTFYFTTNRVFRDTSAWYHICIKFDSTQPTEADRFKFYINGVQETSFASSTYPSLNAVAQFTNTGEKMDIGHSDAGGQFFDGCLSHIHFTQGYAYDATAFGEFDANGVWKIIASPSVTYGTNGFFILKNGNSVTDQSPNTNNFTVGGGTLTNTEDNPSNVFATLNALHKVDDWSLANGNTVFTNNSLGYRMTNSTIAGYSGKFYGEVKIDTVGQSQSIGVIDPDNFSFNTYFHNVGRGYGYKSNDGNKLFNDSVNSSYGDSYTTGDIIGIAMDLDNHKLYYSKNGTWQNSGDPTSGATGTGSAFDLATGVAYTFGQSTQDGGTDPVTNWNFGNGYFGTTAVASAGTNASGNGIFEYDVPTGYTALSTKGLNL